MIVSMQCIHGKRERVDSFNLTWEIPSITPGKQDLTNFLRVFVKSGVDLQNHIMSKK